jgi:hypothetical protein
VTFGTVVAKVVHSGSLVLIAMPAQIGEGRLPEDCCVPIMYLSSWSLANFMACSACAAYQVASNPMQLEFDLFVGVGLEGSEYTSGPLMDA